MDNSLMGKSCNSNRASSGIGEATACALSAQRASVVLAVCRMDRLNVLAAHIRNQGGKAVPVDEGI
ncbi:hypothetical protein [Dictyobacter formicarum]|uniref:Uncharacterized protein n=1 Tax=Dictyobacter formicarum TaxID=2778368 RepID=A0ABQ3VNZ3_9CHLR|nr:hypothetical protein [Dictyobacter formicarum]GHO87116.1 hypothetical protein KSZ_51220 [Dictyobacter formicarum]